MATYQYIAKTGGGEEVAGLIQAESEAAVVRALDERRLFPVRVTPQEQVAKGRTSGRVRTRDVGLLYGQLSDLLGADVPVMRALEILARSTVNKRLTGYIARVREDVAAGKSLADAMADYPDVFRPLHVAMVRAGERAGFLEEVLANLAGFLERQDELRNKVLGAMAYPLLVATVGVIVGVGLLVFLVPQFKMLFDGVAVPLPTRLLFAASDVAGTLWPLVVVGLGGSVMGTWGFFRSERGRRLWDGWRLRIPVLGRVTRLVAITRFCRVLGTMLANGVPLLESLAISKDATGSIILADSIEEASENVRAGETLAEPLSKSGFFPVEILEMIAVAEESNRMEKTLLQIADTVERRTNRQVDLGVRLIEPLILVALASGIAVFAIALVYPIFSMAGSIR
ncbi:MAG TPA: type II secretion system F family protein [Phycisphaerae bacterium]|nr:type II secretion system F family protein [Phycisphaerae bacterium]